MQHTRTALLPILALLACCQNLHSQAQAQSKPEYQAACIGFYNLENLFDTINNPVKFDDDFTPGGKLLWNSEKYISKQGQLAKVISQLGTEIVPDGVGILGVAEIENDTVLRDLVAQPALRARNYQIVWHEGPDERGIDCALLYQPKYFTLTGSQSIPLVLVDASGKRDFTRDMLVVSGTLPGGEALHVMVAHWPSRRGGETGSAPGRVLAAASARHVADSLQKLDPNAKIVFMGDLNDDPDNDSVFKVLRGKPNPKRMDPTDFYNPMYDFYKAGQGTMAYRDAWSLFDQVMVSKALVSQHVGGWQFFKALVFREQWLLQTDGQYKGYPHRTFNGDLFVNGYSDHLPVYCFLLKKKV